MDDIENIPSFPKGEDMFIISPFTSIVNMYPKLTPLVSSDLTLDLVTDLEPDIRDFLIDVGTTLDCDKPVKKVKKCSLKNTGCNCKKSKCLKLYCECFAAKKYCIDCKCNECLNKKKYEKERNIAVIMTIKKNKYAFKPKNNVKKGCVCKKNNCLKKYCDCFHANIFCSSEVCKCVECKNVQK